MHMHSVVLRVRMAILAAAGLLCVAVAPTAAASQDCEGLGGGDRIGNAVVVLAQPVAAGGYTAADGVRLTGMPSFCRIFAVASSHPDSHILIELWMPQADKWNGKFLGIGNGGNAGKIGSSSLAGGLKRGYAAASTDMGSSPAAVPGVEFNFGNGRPEAIKDFGYRATHEMTVLSKDIIARYYGKAADRSYFVGCSTGGNQSLSEAQKFPADYDGIIAGAPAHNRTHMHVHYSALRELGLQPGASVPMPLMVAWQHAIVKACAGRDGGAPSDKFLTNPLQCTVSPRLLSCSRAKDKSACLSDVQIGTLEKIYGGMRNPRTGEVYYHPDVRGAEESIFAAYNPPIFPSSGYDITRWILPRDRPISSFDFDHDLKALDDRYATELNAMDPDLSAFAGRGGKLIIYHGWADGIISPLGSLDYYRQITGGSLPREQFARLFMVPGMGHCASGPGATDFGQLLDIRPEGVVRDDILEALEHWVEKGTAPDRLMAGKTQQQYSIPPFAMAGPVPEARPVCAFPALPRYDGKGDSLKASSFRCVRANYPDFPRPAPAYLR
ncbi:tannase/feruloyl esterase family alpha/beta hydrolase [Sphingopyxis sp.]|uniref:tannase/feruloyl esterase family alpha/beta hydrolase n=1 Tax=Sphingopyxis sp. TaxID=1908224 RepID=UPI002DEFDD9D|nr:tannase/feruloyl esterase family alpha/beta hydrolase [Sphingopyxis sp.]